MSTADQLAADARLHLLQAMGRVVEYRATEVATPVAITAIVGDVMSELLDGEDGTTRYLQRIVEVSTAAGGGGVADPRRRAVLAIDGEIWTVRLIPSIARGLAKLLCVRSVLDESAMAGNRRGMPRGGLR